MSAEIAVGLTWLYTVVLLGVTYAAARRNRESTLQPLVWLGLLTLDPCEARRTQRVCSTPALWALTFLAIETRGRALPVVLMVTVWIFASVVPPPPDPEATIVLWMVVQFVILAVGFFAVLRRYKGVPI